MSVLFRPHRGSLAEAMYEVKEIDSFQEIIDEITEDLWHYGLYPKPEEFHIEYYSEDERIGWSTYIVTLDNYGVIGFTNGNFDTKGDDNEN
jgi:hypothetical protein